MARFPRLARLVHIAVIGAAVAAVPKIAAAQAPVFTHADTLRGSNTAERAWWDVAFYSLSVAFDPADSAIRGSNAITYRVRSNAREMQIDLMTPLEADSMLQNGRPVRFRRDGNAFFATLDAPQPIGSTQSITIYYHGRPRIAKKAPWDGGVVWSHDSAGHPWIATACQGLGASVWWPNKDYQGDEPDSQYVALTVPDSLTAVSNGRLKSTTPNGNGTTTYAWTVTNPINNYDVAAYIGKYSHTSETYAGEAGPLTLDFWPLTVNAAAARTQFEQVKPMLACFEHWFGPYPWYADGYKLVDAPFLGMEHQSAVAYGNHYANGYLGRDLSHTGWGMKWDFIIVHESGHEWFGNNITSQDIADMWVHESFTNYSEGLFTECQFGKAAGAEYVIGLRKNIRNDTPIVSHYGVNEEGSGDMYYKGANMLHTIRTIISDDAKWRDILRGLNKTFWHQTVTGRQVQEYINAQSGINFDHVFTQYLTTTEIPTLEYQLSGGTLRYRWATVIPGFDMPVRVTTAPGTYELLRPTTTWQSRSVTLASPADFKVDENFYVLTKRAD